MAALVLELYRLKFIRYDSLFTSNLSIPISQLYFEALRNARELRTGRATTWRIGNITELDSLNQIAFFRIGRTSTTRQTIFDEVTRRFIETEGEDSPYTQGVLDWSLGVVAIAQNFSLASNTKSLARKFADMLSGSDAVQSNDINVEISPIPDPTGFVRILRASHEIVSFRATFTGPNPTDADAWFSKPLANISAQTGAKEGTIAIKGGKLNKQQVAEAAQNVAKTGNKASARVRRTSNSAPVTEKLNKSSATAVTSSTATDLEIGTAVREKYREVDPNG